MNLTKTCTHIRLGRLDIEPLGLLTYFFREIVTSKTAFPLCIFVLILNLPEICMHIGLRRLELE